jgi:chorismate mutase
MKKELELEEMSSWINAERPLIISGPCSAESENQMVSTAKLLAATGKVNVLRAGIWKP